MCISHLSVSDEGAFAIAARSDCSLRVYDLPDVSSPAPSLPLRCQVRLPSPAWDMTPFPSGNWAAGTGVFFTSCKDMPVCMWDAVTGAQRASYALYNDKDEIIGARSLCVLPGTTRLIAGVDARVHVFDITRPGRECVIRRTRRTRASRDGQHGILATIHAHERRYAVGSLSGSVVVYDDASTGRAACECADDGGGTRVGGSSSMERSGQCHGVTQVMWSPAGDVLYAGYRGTPEVLAWDTRLPSRVLARFHRDVHTQQRVQFALTPYGDGHMLLTGGGDGVMRVYDTSRLALHAAVQPEAGAATTCLSAIACLPDQRMGVCAFGERRTMRSSDSAAAAMASSEDEMDLNSVAASPPLPTAPPGTHSWPTAWSHSADRSMHGRMCFWSAPSLLTPT